MRLFRRGLEIESLTLDMRSSEQPMWASVRKMIVRHGADPQTTALAEHSWDGDYRDEDIYWVAFVTADGRAGEFSYIESADEPWDPTVSGWKPPPSPADGRPPYVAHHMAVARELLEREAVSN